MPKVSDGGGTGKSPRRIALFYGHVASNIGDLAINVGTLQMIADQFPGAAVDIVLLDAAKSLHLDFSASSFDSPLVTRLLHFTSNPVRGFDYLADPAQFLHDCGLDQRPDVILLASGEHLFDYGNDENAKSLFWRMLPGFAGASLGIRVVQMPATFGPFARSASREMVGAYLDICDAWSTRDAASKSYLAEVFEGMDPALNLDPAFLIAAAPKNLEGKPNPVSRSALAMRSDGWGIRLDREKRSEMTAAFRADDHASSRSYRITESVLRALLKPARDEVVIFVQTVADKLLAERLMALAVELGAQKRVTISTPASVADYLQALAQVDRVITSRFHAVILALVKGTSAFGIYFEDHGHKMPGLFDLLSRPDFCTNGSAGTTEACATQVLAPLPQGRVKTQGVLKRLALLRSDTAGWFATALCGPDMDSTGRDGVSQDAALPDQHDVIRTHLSHLALVLADDEAHKARKKQMKDAAPDLADPRADPRADPLADPMAWEEAAALGHAINAARVVLFASDGPAVDLAATQPGKLIYVVSDNLADIRKRRAHFAKRQALSKAGSGVVFCHVTGPAEGAALWAQPYFRHPDLVVMGQPIGNDGLMAGLQAAIAAKTGISVLAGPQATPRLAAVTARWDLPSQAAGTWQSFGLPAS